MIEKKILYLRQILFMAMVLLSPYYLLAQKMGIDVLHPLNFLDVQYGARTGSHHAGLPLYVTGNIGKDKNGIEFRHLNGAHGIGFGYNTIYATGSVTNQSLSLYSKGKSRLSFYTSGLERLQVDGVGHIMITSNLRGPDPLIQAYPLEIRGSNQGISITVDGKAKNAHNYIGFFDLRSRPMGRIEGQTYLETLQSFDYIWNTIMYSLDVIIPTAEAIACGLNAIPDPAEIASNTYAAAIASGDLIEYQITTLTNYGVSYASRGADYAEWIEKQSTEEEFSAGEIVGVKHGKISKNTAVADHLMVISMAPVVLGNMPPEQDKANFEKVAFLGQVWVKVNGDVAPGDYILASGWNDGTGYAVHPQQLNGNELDKIVGVAWTGASASNGFSLVKVAVGLKNKSLANMLEKRNNDNIALESQLNSITAYLEENDPKFKDALARFLNTTPMADSSLKTTPLKSLLHNNRQNNLLKIVKDHPEYLANALKKIKAAMSIHGYDFENHPEVKRLLDDENYFLDMYKGNFASPGNPEMQQN